MESAIPVMVLGPLMIVFTVIWFSWMFWDGMRRDTTPPHTTRQLEPGEPGPWWTNDGFSTPEPERGPVEPGNRVR